MARINRNILRKILKGSDCEESERVMDKLETLYQIAVREKFVIKKEEDIDKEELKKTIASVVRKEVKKLQFISLAYPCSIVETMIEKTCERSIENSVNYKLTDCNVSALCPLGGLRNMARIRG